MEQPGTQLEGGVPSHLPLSSEMDPESWQSPAALMSQNSGSKRHIFTSPNFSKICAVHVTPTEPGSPTDPIASELASTTLTPALQQPADLLLSILPNINGWHDHQA